MTWLQSLKELGAVYKLVFATVCFSDPPSFSSCLICFGGGPVAGQRVWVSSPPRWVSSDSFRTKNLTSCEVPEFSINWVDAPPSTPEAPGPRESYSVGKQVRPTRTTSTLRGLSGGSRGGAWSAGWIGIDLSAKRFPWSETKALGLSNNNPCIPLPN